MCYIDGCPNMHCRQSGLFGDSPLQHRTAAIFRTLVALVRLYCARHRSTIATRKPSTLKSHTDQENKNVNARAGVCYTRYKHRETRESTTLPSRCPPLGHAHFHACP